MITKLYKVFQKEKNRKSKSIPITILLHPLLPNGGRSSEKP